MTPEHAPDARLKLLLGRVLILDPGSQSARLLSELLKGLGSRDITVESDDGAWLRTAAAVQPTLVVVEGLGGQTAGFIRALRRSSLACRAAPVIVTSTDATTSAIRAVRDAGAHEFLLRPFSIADLVLRLESLALRPRPWVESAAYVGPDRRRFRSGPASALQRRTTDHTLSI